MREDETATLIALLTARYGKVSWETNPRRVHAMWHAVLFDVPLSAAQEAAEDWMRREDQAPDPAALRRRVVDTVAQCRGEAESLHEAEAHLTSDDPVFRGSPVTSAAVAVLGGWRSVRAMPAMDRQRYWKRAYIGAAEAARARHEGNLRAAWEAHCARQAMPVEDRVRALPWRALPREYRQALVTAYFAEANRRGSYYAARLELLHQDGDVRAAATAMKIDLAPMPAIEAGEGAWVKQLTAVTA